MMKIRTQYCGASTAQVPAVIIAILDILYSTLILAVLGFITHTTVNKPDDLQQIVQRVDPERVGNLANFLEYSSGEQMLMLAIPITSNAVALLMGLFLLVSSIRKHGNSLRIWFILTMIFMAIEVAIFTVQITGGRNTAAFIVPGIFAFAFRIYTLWIVKCFIKEINNVAEEEAAAATEDDTVVVEAEPDPE